MPLTREVKIDNCNTSKTIRTYHMEVSLNDDKYFFVVESEENSIETNYFTKPFVVTSIERGCTWWDCQKPIKKSEKKQIEKIVEDFIVNLHKQSKKQLCFVVKK